MPAGIYIHVPFCQQKCPYCDFYSEPFSPGTAQDYMGAVRRSFPCFPPLSADTLYFGGGTPSLLPPDEIARTVDAAAERFSLPCGGEITLEANPATLDRQGLRDLRRAGINRLSVGVQSLDDGALRRAGRRHTAAQAVAFLQDAAEAGFSNLSADVMLGLPGETPELLSQTLEGLVSLPITHLSAYMLKRMPGTPFYDHPPEDLPGDEDLADRYLLCCDILEQHGFQQYEISNFARPGYESRHNLKYWQCEDYIGVGAAAHGCIGGERYSFGRDLGAFCDAFRSPPPSYRDAAIPEGVVDGDDFILLSLRTTSGLNLDELYKMYHRSLSEQAERLAEQCCREGLATRQGAVLCLTRRGFLVSNAILAGLL